MISFYIFKFRYATKLDVLFMFIGIIGSIGSGCTFPFAMLFFTNMIDSFISNGVSSACNQTYLYIIITLIYI
jgi:hypothetical protein